MNKHQLTPATTLAFAQAFDWLCALAHETAVSHLFWDKRRAVIELCDKHGLGDVARNLVASQNQMLIVSEIGEACEGNRKQSQDEHLPAFTSEEVEYADAVIRIADDSRARGLRVAQAIVAKLAFNESRSPMHGGKQF